MTLEAKCEAIASVIASSCTAAGYSLSSDDCASDQSFTASNVLCPGTPFALGISNDPNDFDQTDAGPLPDGEAETICAPPPGSVSTLRLGKSGGAAGLRLTWNDAAHDDSYLVYEDQAAGGVFDSQVGTVPSGTSGLTMPMPTQNEFFLVAGNNAICGTGPKR
jgi:hypothetical protein